MYNRIVLGGLILALAMGVFFGFCISSCFAQDGDEESITITTYYPSPYGVYNELQSNKLAVGDTDDDGELTAADQPNRDGDIRLKPQPDDPATWSAGEEGQFAYSQVNDELYHYNGSDWVAQAGGGGTVISLKCSWTGGSVSSCVPPTCLSGWTDLGTGCAVTTVCQTAATIYGGYCERWCKE
jgi:hypothetical protein